MTASPISLTILAGGSTTSSASRARRPATLQLLARDRLAELGEPDEVGERDRGVAARRELPGRELLGGHDVLTQHLAHVQVKTCSSHGPASGSSVREHLLEPARQRVLVGARLQQRLADERADRLGVARHPATETRWTSIASSSAKPAWRTADPSARSRGRARRRRARPVLARQGRARAGGPGRSRGRGRSPRRSRAPCRGPRSEQALDREQRQPLLGDRAPQVLERDAVGMQLVEQRAARGAPASFSTPSRSPSASQSIELRTVQSGAVPELTGRVVAVTGGGRGSASRPPERSARGARVAVGDLDTELAEAAGGELGAALDVTSRDSFAPSWRRSPSGSARSTCWSTTPA